MNKYAITSAAALLISVLAMLGVLVIRNTNTHIEAVTVACNRAITTNYFADCKRLQSKYHMEYMCTADTKFCWVEQH